MKKTDYDNLTAPTRQRTSVAIQGLDTSTPDDIVADGACEKLHNLRFKDGAWRPINNFNKSRTINNPSEVVTGVIIEIQKVFTRFSPLGEEAYICSATITESNILNEGYAAIDLSNGDYAKIVNTTPSDNANIRCFGNIVYIDDKAYLFKDERFSLLDTEGFYTYNETKIINKTPRKPDFFQLPISITTKHFNKTIQGNRWYSIKNKDSGADVLQDILTNEYPRDQSTTITLGWELADRDDNYLPGENLIPDTYAGLFAGEHAYFTAFRMADGTLLNPSALSIATTQNTWDDVTVVGEKCSITTETGYQLSTYDEEITQKNIFIATQEISASDYKNGNLNYLTNYATVQITLNLRNSNLIPSSVKSVAVFSTRLYPSLKRNLSGIGSGSTTRDLFNDIKLPEEPFFLLKEIPLIDFSTGDEKYPFEVTYESLTDVIHNTVYTPTINNKISSAGDFDYNQRLHMFNTSQQIPKAQYLRAAVSGDSESAWKSGVSLLSDGKEYVKWGTKETGNGFTTPFGRILSFHDARIDNFLMYSYDGDKTCAFPASNVLGNNISYYIAPSIGLTRYPNLELTSGINSSLRPTTSNDTIHEPNRIQVSAPNNPLSLPFNLSYKVGSSTNKILALQASSMQVAEEKVGDLPLYVFTEEGIYALRAGSETVYAKTEFINFDKIVNPNTIAVDGAIIYVTYQGVHLLKGTTSTIISTPIHDGAGLMPTMLYSCKMMRSNQFREVIFFEGTDSTTKAYVYNLDTGYWSTRDMSGIQINNDEIYTSDGTQIKIYNTTKETTQSLPSIEIKTRPIKLGNVEFKRLETVIPRISTKNTTYRVITLEGSNTLSYTAGWSKLYNAVYKDPYPVFRRTPFSARYFRFHLEGEITENTFAITNIDFEWYERFRRKMR